MIILDIQALQTRAGFDRGIPRYVTQHCRELLKVPGLVHSICLNPTRPFPKNLNLELLYSGKLVWGSAAAIRRGVRDGALTYWILSPFEEEASFETLLPRCVVDEGARIVVTLYDLIPLVLHQQYPMGPEKRVRYAQSLQLVKMAERVLCISERTQADAIKRLGIPAEKTRVIGAGVSSYFNPEDGLSEDAAILQRDVPGLRQPFLFTVLGEDPRKNLDGLLTAYAQLPAELRSTYSLVLGGNFPRGRQMHGVYFTYTVGDDCLRALYRSCSLFVFPSKYEGFGLPVAEALACGARAIASNLPPTRDLLPDSEWTFDANDEADMAKCMERALLVKAKPGSVPRFPWSKVAQRSVEALPTIAPPMHRKRHRLAIALVGPFPPQQSGIADINVSVARELARVCDLLLFYTGHCDLPRLRELGAVSCQPVKNLGTRFAPQYLDSIVYSLGNSHHHVETLDKVLQYPGILWLHDVHLLDLYNSRRAHAGLPAREPLRETAERIYGNRLPPEHAAFDPFDGQKLQDWGVHFSTEIVRASRGLIVSSQHAFEMAVLDQGPLSRVPPAWIVPLPAFRNGPQEPVAAPAPHGPFVISTFGFLGGVKAPDLLIDVLALLPPELNARLDLVGYAHPAYEGHLLGHARRMGVLDRMRITGFVNGTEWFEHVRQSSCAVQLRRQSNGESSGAVVDCMSSGLPVITNIAACMQMPQDAVVHVPWDVTASQLSAQLQSLLTDGARWMRYHEGGLRYAHANSIELTARKVLDAVAQLCAESQASAYARPVSVPIEAAE